MGAGWRGERMWGASGVRAEPERSPSGGRRRAGPGGAGQVAAVDVVSEVRSRELRVRPAASHRAEPLTQPLARAPRLATAPRRSLRAAQAPRRARTHPASGLHSGVVGRRAAVGRTGSPGCQQAGPDCFRLNDRRPLCPLPNAPDRSGESSPRETQAERGHRSDRRPVLRHGAGLSRCMVRRRR